MLSQPRGRASRSSARFLVTLTAVTGTCLAAAFAPATTVRAAPGDTKSFVLLHSNDQHGHLLPFSYPDRATPGDDITQMPVRKNIGGIARRATLIKDIKSRERNVYVFDAGDCMDGTPFSTEFQARADYDAMNAVGYDYGVFGNHDFNMTVPQFDELKRTVKFPLLLANVYNKTDKKPALAPYTIANWNGLKVAIFGLVTYSARSYKAAAEAYTMRDPLDVARELVPVLRKQADLVILVAHDGLDVDQKMAQDIPGIDIIVGGHSHTRLPVGAYQTAAKPGPLDPPGTIILQAHQWVGELGRLDFTVTEGTDKRWRITRYQEQLLPITDKIKEDPKVASVVNGYWDKIKNKYGVVVGEATAEFTDTRSLDIDPTNYYLVADAMRAAAPGADFDLENRSGVRAPILKGAITFGDIVAVDPFENTVFTFKIKGSALKSLLTQTRPLSSAGLRYAVTRNAETGAWSLVSATVNGKPIEDETIYNGAASSFYFTASVKSKSIEFNDLGTSRRDAILNYIKKNTPISPVEDGRNNFGGADPFVQPAAKTSGD